jgi:hypothetical protein
VELFGAIRAEPGAQVTVQTKNGRKAKWRTVRTVTLNSRGYFDIHARLSRASKRYFRFFGSGEPASRTAKAVKR